MCMAFPETVTLTRDQAIGVLAALEGAHFLIADKTLFLGIELDVTEALELVSDKLYPL
jgi:hypothetical protein